MRVYDVIAKKRDGKILTKEEIDFFIRALVAGRVSDEQAGALLMAMYIHSLSRGETVDLTLAMTASGDFLNFGKGLADKHSTGGVGDKTTLVILPVMAACGVKMAKLSGRALGHTGGTIDKMESIKGFRCALSDAEIKAVLEKVGCAIAAQSEKVAPADKKLYALRDVTATVDSIPLIAASVMSKKLSVSSEALLLDVKCGSGAFMKTRADAEKLADIMLEIGRAAGKKVRAVISNMNEPLGKCVGNALEVLEAAEILKGRGDKRLSRLCFSLCGEILRLLGYAQTEAEEKISRAVSSGGALLKFKDLIEAQGGDAAFVENPALLLNAKHSRDFLARRNGFITGFDCRQVGVAALALGAGRARKEDPVDPGAGIVFEKKTGDAVKKGDTAARLFASDDSRFDEALRILNDAVFIGEEKVAPEDMIYGIK